MRMKIIAAAAAIASLGFAEASNGRTASAGVEIGGKAAINPRYNPAIDGPAIGQDVHPRGSCVDCPTKPVEQHMSVVVGVGVIDHVTRPCTYFEPAIGWVACKVTDAQTRIGAVNGHVR